MKEDTVFSEEIENALNEQLNEEFFSWYTYLAMSSYFKKLNLDGFSRWMSKQAQREMTHAMKIYEFLHEREGGIMFRQINEPPPEWDSPLAAAELAYLHEQEASGRIDRLVDLAMSDHAHATSTFLQWFVNEQVEEEARLRSIVKKLELIGEDRYGLFLIDRDMG